tara:strand:+ start:476 stop:871 length:396 start_codon:yes stop_codon:yes gene_type:complete
MRIYIFRSFFVFLLILFGTKISALTNDEVRTEIQSWIDTQTFPQDIDANTVLIGIQVSTRGIVYNYKLKLPGDEISNFLQVFDNIKMGAINALCELPELNWYKENQVEMIYTYMDENDNLVTSFKIHSSKC